MKTKATKQTKRVKVAVWDRPDNTTLTLEFDRGTGDFYLEKVSRHLDGRKLGVNEVVRGILNRQIDLRHFTVVKSERRISRAAAVRWVLDLVLPCQSWPGLKGSIDGDEIRLALPA